MLSVAASRASVYTTLHSKTAGLRVHHHLDAGQAYSSYYLTLSAAARHHSPEGLRSFSKRPCQTLVLLTTRHRPADATGHAMLVDAARVDVCWKKVAKSVCSAGSTTSRARTKRRRRPVSAQSPSADQARATTRQRWRGVEKPGPNLDLQESRSMMLFLDHRY